MRELASQMAGHGLLKTKLPPVKNPQSDEMAEGYKNHEREKRQNDVGTGCGSDHPHFCKRKTGKGRLRNITALSSTSLTCREVFPHRDFSTLYTFCKHLLKEGKE
jgi:hypothetical protein